MVTRWGAGTAALRWAIWAASRLAADCVRAYPVVYTASTAEQLAATSRFAIFLLDPPPPPS